MRPATYDEILPDISMTRAINDSLDWAQDEYEADMAYESVLDYALESILTIAEEAEAAVAAKKQAKTANTTPPKGHVIAPKVRNALPDKAFGIPESRKYPLIVKNDPDVTRELITKAIQMFHYCKPEWKPELAKNIVKAIKTTGMDIKINSNSMICKFTTVPDSIKSTPKSGVKTIKEPKRVNPINPHGPKR